MSSRQAILLPLPRNHRFKKREDKILGMETLTPQIENHPRRQAALDRAEYWRGQHEGLHFKITLWGVGGYNPHGTWCYYVYFSERYILNFDELWLPPKLIKTTPESHGFVSYDYNDLSLAHVDWHGGVTYYEKHGELKGFRCVELGCDYAHLYDHERGFPYHLDEVVYDCKKTIEAVIPKLSLSPDFPRPNAVSVSRKK